MGRLIFCSGISLRRTSSFSCGIRFASAGCTSSPGTLIFFYESAPEPLAHVDVPSCFRERDSHQVHDLPPRHELQLHAIRRNRTRRISPRETPLLRISTKCYVRFCRGRRNRPAKNTHTNETDYYIVSVRVYCSQLKCESCTVDSAPPPLFPTNKERKGKIKDSSRAQKIKTISAKFKNIYVKLNFKEPP